MYYKQCQMVKSVPGGEQVHVSWIPEELAKVGKSLELLVSNGKWDAGWVVSHVFTRMSEEYVREHEDDHKHQHKASDKLTRTRA